MLQLPLVASKNSSIVIGYFWKLVSKWQICCIQLGPYYRCRRSNCIKEWCGYRMLFNMWFSIFATIFWIFDMVILHISSCEWSGNPSLVGSAVFVCHTILSSIECDLHFELGRQWKVIIFHMYFVKWRIRFFKTKNLYGNETWKLHT
jgi:hypothetical protein